MWFFYLKKYFPGKRWKKYHKRIIFYIYSVNYGLKPSFMWDFGAAPVVGGHLNSFVEDLKNSGLISREIIVINVSDYIFISNVSHLLLASEENKLIVDVTSKNETDWSLHETNDFLTYFKSYMKEILNDATSGGEIVIRLRHKDSCLPTVFGFLLGFPLLYYFKLNYQAFSLNLKLFQVKCKFNFFTAGEEFVICSFSIPNNLYNENVKVLVNEWFNKIKQVDEGAYKHVKMESNDKYVNSLIL